MGDPRSKAAECPECGETAAVPRQSLHADAAPQELICGACGYDWSADAPEAVAAAWYSEGATDGIDWQQQRGNGNE